MAKAARFPLVLAVAAACLLPVAGTASAAPSHPSRPAAKLSSLETSVFSSVNAVRVSHGLRALRLSTTLSAAARQHSAEMAGRGYFAHESADGSAFWKRVQHFYPMGRYHSWSVGENLVWASPDLDAAGAVQMWMDSPEHRANILKPGWRELGISAVQVDAAPGVFGGGATTIITTDFGARS